MPTYQSVGSMRVMVAFDFWLLAFGVAALMVIVALSNRVRNRMRFIVVFR